MPRDPGDSSASPSHASSDDAATGDAGRGTDERQAVHEEPVLPSRSSDETDVGWGDEPSTRDGDWYRRERPPHHE